ncbi:hypothetical protein EJ04DRAFT_528824 [Polyplosphaeria fusca]|uniref:Uncharacterized protein n=1 Tax=Polyplosphaeria fusca TaxID=682080 RepID=A0A9P4QNS0_9PLEO|nr:hypothetical protein EJ04DRAFT_528824 [Polyplosphaeria fusca]
MYIRLLPPPECASRGRPVKKRMKQKTREIEARRVGHLVQASSQKEQGNTYDRFQPDVRSFQQQSTPLSASNASSQIPLAQNGPKETGPDQRVSSQTLPDQVTSSYHANLHNSTLSVELDNLGEQDALRQQIRAIQTNLTEARILGERYWAQHIGTARQAVNESNNEHTNTYSFGTSSTVPDIIIYVSASPGGIGGSVAGRDEDESSVQSRQSEPPALSTRSRKRAQTTRS